MAVAQQIIEDEQTLTKTESDLLQTQQLLLIVIFHGELPKFRFIDCQWISLIKSTEG